MSFVRSQRVMRARHDLCSPLQTLLSTFAVALVTNADGDTNHEELLCSVEATALAAKQLAVEAATWPPLVGEPIEGWSYLSCNLVRLGAKSPYTTSTCESRQCAAGRFAQLPDFI